LPAVVMMRGRGIRCAWPVGAACGAPAAAGGNELLDDWHGGASGGVWAGLSVVICGYVGCMYMGVSLIASSHNTNRGVACDRVERGGRSTRHVSSSKRYALGAGCESPSSGGGRPIECPSTHTRQLRRRHDTNREGAWPVTPALLYTLHPLMTSRACSRAIEMIMYTWLCAVPLTHAQVLGWGCAGR
jgi:hypothetical protein